MNPEDLRIEGLKVEVLSDGLCIFLSPRRAIALIASLSAQLDEDDSDTHRQEWSDGIGLGHDFSVAVMDDFEVPA